MTRNVSICMPTVRAGSVSAAIESIRRQEHEAWELVVVMQGDDAELQHVIARAERDDGRIRGVWIPHRGVSRARNAAAGAASFDTIAFVDDDCEAAPDWLSTLVSALDHDRSVGVVAGALVAPPPARPRPSKCPESIPGDFTVRPSPDDTELPAGARFVTASCAVERWAWERVGRFDEELGAGTSFRGGEDLDFLLRVMVGGVPIRFCPAAVVRHTAGRRYGIRSVLAMSVGYATGQGAVAAKLDRSTPAGDEWRRAVWDECLLRPLTRLRIDRIVPRIPRLTAFERGYRRCRRDFVVDEAGLLVAAIERTIGP